MGHGPALIIEPYEQPLMFDLLSEVSRQPIVDRLLFILSFRQGLRSCEMSALTWDAVLTPRGQLSDEVFIAISKGRDSRRMFMHPELPPALDEFHQTYPGLRYFAPGPRDGRQMSPGTLSAHFKRLFEAMGFIGCTSHTGRASCITELARRCTEYGCSLVDVQKYAGHKHLSSTAKYLRASESARRLVDGLGNGFTNRGRQDYGLKASGWNNRYANPAHLYAHRQHENWVAQQFACLRVQSQWGPERGSGTAWYR